MGEKRGPVTARDKTFHRNKSWNDASHPSFHDKRKGAALQNSHLAQPCRGGGAALPMATEVTVQVPAGRRKNAPERRRRKNRRLKEPEELMRTKKKKRLEKS